jgi:hypothetical protein
VAALQEYNDILTEVSALVDAYQQDIQTLQSLQAQPDSKIRRQSTSATTIESIEMNILGAQDSILDIEDALGKIYKLESTYYSVITNSVELDEAKLNVNALFSRAQSLDIAGVTDPIVGEALRIILIIRLTYFLDRRYTTRGSTKCR